TVTKVNKENGRVNGVTVKTSEGEKVINAKTVLLATGGFGAAQDIIKKYRPDLASYKTTNHPGATGDGIKLAEELGAQVVQMNLIQVHPTVQQDTPHAFLIGEAVRGEGGILVNGEGQRFVNELNTRKVVSNAITALPEHSAYLIFDKDIRSRVKAIEFYDSIGLVEHGSDLKELAEKINVPADKLEVTVNNWNQMVAAGKDTDFDRKTGMERKISEAPYYAIHIAPAIHYTMGGIHIDSRTRVIDGNGDIIPGLLAAGEVAGGLHGNNRIGGNSIAETVIFGIQAGREAFLEK
ncbi:flavocytochrome c, partial [Lactobacillus salivarius]|nr:flavocytochrome c [Ligilactobacillus salivarius]